MRAELDTAVVEHARAVAAAAQEEFFALESERAVVVSAVAGAGSRPISDISSDLSPAKIAWGG